MLTRERLKELFSYEPCTGVFKRIKRTRGVSVNRPVGFDIKGYLKVRIDGNLHFLHRLAFLYMGESCDEVDHIDGNKKNNSWVNLRSTSRTTNLRNSDKSHLNKFGIQGLRKTPSGKFQVRVGSLYLGTYDTLFDAACARFSKENELGYMYRNRVIQQL